MDIACLSVHDILFVLDCVLKYNRLDKLHSCLNLSFALILLFHCKMRYFASYYLKNTFQHLCYQVKILENCYFFLVIQVSESLFGIWQLS